MVGAYWCQSYSSLTTTLSRKPPSTGIYGENLSFKSKCNKAHAKQRDPCRFCHKIKYHANHICRRKDKEMEIPEHEHVILENIKKRGLIFEFLLRFCKYSWKDSINVRLALTISRSGMKEDMKEKKPQKLAWNFHINDIFYNQLQLKYLEALCKIKVYQKHHSDVFLLCEGQSWYNLILLYCVIQKHYLFKLVFNCAIKAIPTFKQGLPYVFNVSFIKNTRSCS